MEYIFFLDTAKTLRLKELHLFKFVCFFFTHDHIFPILFTWSKYQLAIYMAPFSSTNLWKQEL